MSTKDHENHNRGVEEQVNKTRRKISLKAILKEEEPQKLSRVMDRIDASRDVIDSYVSRITGMSTKVITTIRNWHKIIERIIIEEGREILNLALEELEQELAVAKALKNSKESMELNKQQKDEEKNLRKKESSQKAMQKEIANPEFDSKGIYLDKKEKAQEKTEKSNLDLLIAQELEANRKKAENSSKTAIEILFKTEAEAEISISQWEKIPKTQSEKKETSSEPSEMILEEEEEVVDLSLITKDEILLEQDDSPLGTSQEEINDSKEYWRRQLEHAVATHKEPRGSNLEASLWAPNENTCEKIGVFKARIAAVPLPGETKEERIKFVEGTLYRSKHISKIEECFYKGNTWIEISFDCLKGVEILKEKLKKKEIEWYKVLFEEHNIKLNKERKEETHNKKSQFLIEDTEEGSSQSLKGKNKDFLWITLRDLPLDYSTREVRRLLKQFGEVEDIKVQKHRYFQTAEVKISIKDKEQENRIRANWVIGLENGKLARLTIGNYDIEKLKEREEFKATLSNVPSTACETLLLRTLSSTGAKAVYIPYNSNRNPRCIAKVFFKSKEDLEKALNRSLYYYNTRLFWKETPESSARIQRENNFKRKERSNSPLVEKEIDYGFRKENKNSYKESSKINRSRKASLEKSQHQSCFERSIASTLDKLLSRLDNLEEKWESRQKPRAYRGPNRS
jgi:hypothetical protein